MGSAEPFGKDMPLEMQIKSLPDEDLLDVWADSQELEAIMDERIPFRDLLGHDFENVIINELSLRACRAAQTRRS